MAELKIKIAADTLSATKGITKVTESINTLGNKVIQSGEGFDQYVEGINRDLQKIYDTNPNEYKALTKEQQLLTQQASKMTIAFGSQSKEAMLLNGALQSAKQAVSDYEKKSAETASTQTQLVDSVDKSADAFENLGKKVRLVKLTEIAKNILKFQLIMMPIQKTIRFVTQTITESMQVAAEAEQVFNKLATVFENNATAMGKAQVMAKSYGTSISTMASSLSTVGDLLQAQGMGKSESLEMAAQWTKAFSDIIAFKDINMSVEEFAQNFMSGAAGNLRNFRTFGSIVKESAVSAELAKRGLSNLSDEELELEKMVIRATLALDQQKNAMGATQKEWDTALSVTRRLTEQWKEFKENLGTWLNKAISPFKKMIAETLEDINNVNTAINEMNTGDYTIKSENAFTLDKSGISQIKQLYEKQLNWNQGNAKLINQNTDLKAGTYWGNINAAGSASGQIQSIYVDIVKSISLATGATVDQIREVLKSVDKSFKNAADGIWELAQQRQEAESNTLKRQDSRTKQLQALEESNLKDYKDALATMFTNTGEMKSWLEGNSFIDHSNADYVLGKNKGTAEENTSTATSEIAAILEYIRTTFTKLETDRASLVSQLTTAQATFNANAVVSNGEVYGIGNGWSQEEAQQQYRLIQSLEGQIKAIDATTASWIAMDEELSVKLEELYTQEAKSSAWSSVKSTSKSLAEENKTNAKRAELEKQYTDDMSYMVDILMQRYEYEKKYNEMLQSLTEAGYTESEATARLLLYKAEYEKALDVATKTAKKEATENKHKERQEAMINQTEWKDYLESLRFTQASQGPYSEVNDWYTEAEKAGREKLNQEVENGNITLMECFQRVQELNGLLNEEYEVRKRNVEQEQLQASIDTVYNAFGDMGNMLQTMNSWTAEDFAQFASIGKEGGLAGGLEGFASSAIGGDIISMLMQIVSQLEVVQAISNFIGDYIVPVLDSFLEPLMPLIQTIGGLIQSLIQGILAPLFPIIVEVSALLTLVCGFIEAGFKLVESSIKWLVGNIMKAIYEVYDAIAWGDQSYLYDSNSWVGEWSNLNPWEEMSKVLDKTFDSVEKIRGCAFDIEKNTSDDVDLSFLNELLAAGIIDEKGYNERAKVKQAGLSWDRVVPGQAKYIDYDYSKGNVSVRSGNVTINIEGGDTEEVKKAVMSALKSAGVNVSGTGYQEYA